ncbi:MAG: polysulfide reductase NrfD [Acidobacteriaceae bacterium]|nr:polysulfide reductase NrfD [Acidobacteriaceae bacterium]
MSEKLPALNAVDDGRNIDPRLGALLGEAAQQTPLATKHDTELHAKTFGNVPSRQSWTSPTYYDHPMLHQPVWVWSIPAYFYVGGVAGVGAMLGAAAQLVAPEAMQSLVIRSRWVAMVGGAMSSALLIYDLGRPERFLHMLRVFRVRSPMNMGSWILTGFSSAAGAAAILPFGPRLFRPLANVCGVVAGVLGLGLSGYTGVLLSQTAVPLWHRSYKITPLLFLASGTAAAASFFEFFPLNEREASAVQRFGLVGKIVELAATLALEANAGRVERVGRPLKQGFSGFLWNGAKVLTIASALLSLLPGKSRPKRVAEGILGSAASACLRFGIYYAGKASARDPRASFEQQRASVAESASVDVA